ncbi:DUF202 domain-containing protein [Hymenobacter sp. J193]|uniref:YidH family protein n=1 Tax=Hymenobacter sp. J193 TaxID=2898429 RepID=UPI0021519978|nr:DUF202 domain-containing protein [Hymenobacter sp. J193]MCR5887822.1 DUF202 domain-containing protein [Hymenobacter sp. J193]
MAGSSTRIRELRDLLALERTQMANERTLLAYVRTGMALVIAGFSLIQFFRQNLFVWAGVALVPAGLAVVLLGWRRYRHKGSALTSRASTSSYTD